MLPFFFITPAPFLRNRIITKSSPGMTTADSSCSQPKAFDWSVDLQCFDHISRTGRIVSACIRKNRTNDPLVDFYRDNQDCNKKSSDIFHEFFDAKLRNNGTLIL